uniref:C3H1-type domain-containing protein n=1 Tax=Chromera velia CCMP2878 TaxID=1169474 RepID=A0A0G4GNI0_9ALVE|eukprot:Cvel_22644.t1-p1 / transcript=Cvel_22644.t1 / gene=Cvel_22644 / organism=Chromera_velia_CCMP2878 / gene_product=hypothetical protein / transcript_product=hypothetical protein / location=Cvel_scaffold2247:10705-12966(+) / protein_length=633 / sequence_SO=supercontig / SO=protein_coding / is_pseudo=false
MSSSSSNEKEQAEGEAPPQQLEEQPEREPAAPSSPSQNQETYEKSVRKILKNEQKLFGSHMRHGFIHINEPSQSAEEGDEPGDQGEEAVSGGMAVPQVELRRVKSAHARMVPSRPRGGSQSGGETIEIPSAIERERTLERDRTVDREALDIHVLFYQNRSAAEKGEATTGMVLPASIQGKKALDIVELLRNTSNMSTGSGDGPLDFGPSIRERERKEPALESIREHAGEQEDSPGYRKSIQKDPILPIRQLSANSQNTNAGVIGPSKEMALVRERSAATAALNAAGETVGHASGDPQKEADKEREAGGVVEDPAAPLPASSGTEALFAFPPTTSPGGGQPPLYPTPSPDQAVRAQGFLPHQHQSDKAGLSLHSSVQVPSGVAREVSLQKEKSHASSGKNSSTGSVSRRTYLSFGTTFHERHTCNPCRYEWTKGCHMGVHCRFCHHDDHAPPGSQRVKPDEETLKNSTVKPSIILAQAAQQRKEGTATANTQQPPLVSNSPAPQALPEGPTGYPFYPRAAGGPGFMGGRPGRPAGPTGNPVVDALFRSAEAGPRGYPQGGYPYMGGQGGGPVWGPQSPVGGMPGPYLGAAPMSYGPGIVGDALASVMRGRDGSAEGLGPSDFDASMGGGGNRGY